MGERWDGHASEADFVFDMILSFHVVPKRVKNALTKSS
jgi:hypothetical protein